MIPEPTAFLDSGVGGLPYLAHARRYLQAERFVYVADRQHFPYGEMSRRQVVESALEVTGRLIRKENPRLIVVACNTMSVVALAELRSQFAVPFVGVVPAVKPAASLSRRKRVGILATRRTVEDEYLRNLIQRYAAGCTVVSLSSAALVSFVEQDLPSATPEERQARVKAEVDRFASEGIDALVLGCTHFLHLENEFRAQLQAANIQLVDSRDGVSRQAARLLRGTRSNPVAPGLPGPDRLYVTGPRPLEDRYQWFASQYRLELEEEL